MKFEDQRKYWLEANDGSKLLVVAQLAGDGEYDLYNEAYDWSIWADPGNLQEFKITGVM